MKLSLCFEVALHSGGCSFFPMLLGFAGHLVKPRRDYLSCFLGYFLPSLEVKSWDFDWDVFMLLLGLKIPRGFWLERVVPPLRVRHIAIYRIRKECYPTVRLKCKGEGGLTSTVVKVMVFILLFCILTNYFLFLKQQDIDSVLVPQHYLWQVKRYF